MLSHRCVERVPCGSAQQPRRSLDAGVAVPVEASGEQRLRLRRRHHDGEHVAVWRDGHLGAGGGEVMRRGGDALVAHLEKKEIPVPKKEIRPAAETRSWLTLSSAVTWSLERCLPTSTIGSSLTTNSP